ncbi:unnamed protein product [Acanthoscelides obtectus]|uniref:Uncharacterized protein n=1 Tax=Acanthoscelides obtectus TaxID=200917 RepID=A0A9P0KNN3_ACAOB|nr:unnamed protein product [Acanthoscelides obtectus]CAK1623697.1 hypothetical protein AOBTE_LOCUS2125 [Acanthoscelides obtectus]
MPKLVPLNVNSLQSLFFRPVTEEYISSIITNLKRSDSTGDDVYSTNLLKKCYMQWPLGHIKLDSPVVDQQLLLHKLEQYGVRRLPLMWFESYLSDSSDRSSMYKLITTNPAQLNAALEFLRAQYSDLCYI